MIHRMNEGYRAWGALINEGYRAWGALMNEGYRAWGALMNEGYRAWRALMNEGYRAWGALQSVLSNGGLGINPKKCQYEGVIVPTALHGAEAVRSAERRKVNS